MTRYYVEWCLSLKSRKGNMVSIEDLPKVLKLVPSNTGYRSCYMFREEDAKEIKQSKCSVGFKQYSVASDKIFIDIDDGNDLPKVEAVIKERGYRYSVWFSGKKGYHIYLYHDLIDSPDLPYSHRAFVESLGIPNDPSIYRHSSIISLPGRRHPTTGKKKILLRTSEGEKVTFPLLTAPTSPTFAVEKSDKDEIYSGLFSLIDLISKQPSVGTRHTTLWGTAKDLRRSGLSYETVFELLELVNGFWDNPKTAEELKIAVENAYR